MHTSRVFACGVFCLYYCLAYVAHAQAEVAPPSDRLTVRGAVRLQDGKPAANACVESVPSDLEHTIRAYADKRGCFELSGQFGRGCRLHVQSADATEQATWMVAADQLRLQAEKPIVITLAPAKHQVVTVLSTSGQPVSGAHVQASGRSRSFRAGAVTGADGKAILSLPAGEAQQSLDVWHSTLGVASRRESLQGLEGDSYQLVLLPTATHIIRFVGLKGEPVPNLSFGVDVKPKNAEWVLTERIEAAGMRTDAQGEVVAPWFPKELQYVDVPTMGLMAHDWKIDENDLKTAEGVTTVHVRPKFAVSGRLNLPPGASAEGILVRANGFGPKNLGDSPTARAAADGLFTLWAATDHGYAINIDDFQWASDGWTGVILANENAQPAKIAIDVYPATPLEIRVTRGEKHEGVANAGVHVCLEQEFAWKNAKNEKQYASGSIGKMLCTDRDGVVHCGVGKGKQRVQIGSGRWNEERTIDVDSGGPVSVEFHRPWSAQRTITGRVLKAGSPFTPTSDTKIEAASVGPRHQRFALTSALNPDGTFAVTGDASDVSILVTDRGQRLTGLARLGPNESSIDLPLAPTACFIGAIVDQQGQPIVGQTLRLVVKDTDHVAAEDQVSDTDGRFKFAIVAADAPLSVQLRQEIFGRGYFRQIGELLLLPGEQRDNTRLLVNVGGADRLKAPVAAPAPVAQRLLNVARNARLGGMHVLTILQGDATDKVSKFVKNLSDWEEHSDILAYVELSLDEKAVEANAAALKDLAWPLPQKGEVVLVALDGDGKQLGAQRIAVGDVAAAKLATAMLKGYLPPTRDAQARLAAAQEDAKRTDRKLWIVDSGPRCGPCFQLARWIDDQHALLEKDYVILKLMGGIDQRAEEVIQPLNPSKNAGIPWFAITDTAGKVLVTSESPLGNIGMPSSIEGIRHLHAMFKQTAQRLTSEEIDRLADSLAKPQ